MSGIWPDPSKAPESPFDHGKRSLPIDGFATVRPVMFLIFILWAVTYVGIFLHKKWTIPMAVVSIVYTLVMLRFHMTDPIPLSF